MKPADDPPSAETVVMRKMRPVDEHDQPMPLANTNTPIIDLVLKWVNDPLVRQDFLDRSAVGLQRYGTLLQAHNGRDALKDARDEFVDGPMYLMQAFEEEEDALEKLVLAELLMAALQVTTRTRHALERRNAKRRPTP